MKTHRIEILETRIAPASFLVTSDGLQILDSTSVDATLGANEAAAETVSLSDAVVLLATGDKLFFDTDGDRIADGSELILTVTTGKAMAFFDDRDSDLRFSRLEFRGLAVSAGFGGTLKGSIFGDIVTGLDGGDNLTAAANTFTLQPGDITGLTITGTAETIAAGGNISKLKAGGPAVAEGGNAVDLILTGTALDDSASSVRLGGKNFNTVAFNPTAGSNGGSITDVTLIGGASSIATGAGGDAAAGLAGRGGDILRVKATNTQGMDFRTGAGGSSTNGAGGAGGDAFDITIATARDIAPNVFFFTGAGGDGGVAGNGGAGGNAARIKISGPQIADMTLTTGFGGEAGASGGTGGAGGNLSDFTFTTTAYAERLNFDTGDGGDGFAAGGAGGRIERITVKTAYAAGNYEIEAGTGGDAASGTGGDGGAISTTGITVSAGPLRVFSAFGGHGGDGSAGGGDGGTIAAMKFKTAFITDDFDIRGGTGGDATTSGPGGAGGAVQKTTLTIGSIFDAIDSNLLGGAGGDSAGGGIAGNGGAVDGIVLTAGSIPGRLFVSGGSGGDGGGAGSSAGMAARSPAGKSPPMARPTAAPTASSPAASAAPARRRAAVAAVS